MKKIVLWFATTFSIVVLLFGYRTSTNTTTASAATSAVSPLTGTPTTPTTAAAGTTTSSTSSSGNAVTAPSSTSAGNASTSTSASTTSSAAPAASTTTTYTGSVASTRWGDVQVAITVTDGTITAVDVPEYPSGNGKDQQINARALPILVQETLSSQSASIDMVTGATVTSDGYLESLQSALDQAGV